MDILVDQEWQERTRLTNILPEDVWDIVFNRISSPKDYHALCNASPHFLKWLHLSKPRICIATIVQYYTKLLTETLNANRESDVNVPYFWSIVKRMLPIRSLSKSLRSVVDTNLGSCLQNQNNLSASMRFYLKYTFRTFNDLERFDNQFKNYNGNPFLFRVVFIKYEFLTGSPLSIFLDKLQQLFATHGHHIWYFQLDINPRPWYSSAIPLSHHYRIITRLLQHLPNLKNFHLVQPLYLMETQQINRSVNEANEIRKCLDQNPVPILKNLKYFTGPVRFDLLFQHFVNRNPHVEALRGVYDYEGDAEDVYTGPLTNIKNLHLSFQLYRQFMALTTSNYVWQTKKLTLNLEQLSIEWDTLFDCLNTRFGHDQLKEFIVYMPERKIGSPATKSLEFSALTHVQLYMNNYFPLDFLLKSKSTLVNLKIRVAASPPNNFCKNAINIKDSSKLFCCRETLRKSSIWTRFPALENLSYQDQIQEVRINREELKV